MSKYREYVERKIMPFWLENSIDNRNGGIYTCLDEDGNIYGTDKSVWFQGRALYIFSLAYNLGYRENDYLSAALKIYEFLPRCEDGDGRMYFTVTSDGRGIQKRRYYFSETFAAIGCAEYYLATGDEKAKESAERYFSIAYNIFKNPSLTVPKLNPENAPFKSLSPVMIMLATAQVFRKIDFEKYDAIARDMAEEIIDGGYLKEKYLLEHVLTDGNFSDSPMGRTVNPGHSLECAWFLLTEGLAQKNDEILKTAKKIIDISMDIGYKNGGIIAFCDCLGRPPQALEWDMQLWWPQCEAIIANKMCYELFKEEKYKQNFERLYQYTLEHFENKLGYEWYGYLHYDGTVANNLIGNIFKGPFHIPRMFMLLDCLERGIFFL